MHSWKAHWPLSLSHRRQWFSHGCHCTPESRRLSLPHAVTSDMLWLDATVEKETETNDSPGRGKAGRERREIFINPTGRLKTCTLLQLH